MPEYLMLLHEITTGFADLSARDIQGFIDGYVSWRNAVAAEGILTGGKKLCDEGGKQLMEQNGLLRVTDGPYAEAREVVVGYFSILAENYDEAIKTAGTCPILKYGGRIDIREVELP